ncbi:GDSL esterase/lipase [Senna tora]|uniref:GDSL esterase/lipase n=1 Tax=Senna tora TaxID=362788 RepID=A0A834T7L8_9FABA|nr:GDSL esterase/lipase [Senna tora]
MRGFLHLLPSLVLLLTRLLTLVHAQFQEESPPTTTTTTLGFTNASALYVLGDSTVDCGDNTLFYPLLHARLSLYPCNGSDSSLLPQLLGFLGEKARSKKPPFCLLFSIAHLLFDGFTHVLWPLVERCEKMGLPFIRPFYGQNGSLDEVISGLNFGSTQATIMSKDSSSHQSLSQQLRQVSDTLQLLQLQLTEDIALHFTKSSIFFLSFGKEDFIDLFLHNFSSQVFDQSTAHDFPTMLVNQMTNAMRYLYDVNARKIICLGILPLGYTPHLAWLCNQTSLLVGGDDDNGESCVDEANKLVLEYNNLLYEHISMLNVEFTDAQIVFCDVYKGMMQIINWPKLYGFEDTRSACCGLGLNSAMIGCISLDGACEEASTHVWWDLFNPTHAVNSILADAAWSGLPFSGLCQPITIHELVSKNF